MEQRRRPPVPQEPPIPEVVPTIKEIQQVTFGPRALAVGGLAGSGITIFENTPFAGYIKQVTPHWPGGCRALVDIAVGHGLIHFCPRENFLALDNATPTYPFNEEVMEGEEIWVILQNRDGLNPHTITVTLNVERK